MPLNLEDVCHNRRERAMSDHAAALVIGTNKGTVSRSPDDGPTVTFQNDEGVLSWFVASERNTFVRRSGAKPRLTP